MENTTSDTPVEPIKGPAVTINKRSKPDIEGITIPATGIKPKLTRAEQMLIDGNPSAPQQPPSVSEFKSSSPRITMPPRKSPALKWLLIIIFIAILAVGGFLGYEKYYGSASPQKNYVNNYPVYVPTTTPTPLPTPTPESTTTLNSLITPTPAASVTGASTNTLSITSTPTGYLNVRKTPSSSAPIVTKVNPGETYTFIDSKSGWYEITLTDGSTGWISGQYAKVQK